MRQAGEPSVEEILESIKKVIARDNRAEADNVRRRREEDGMVTTRTLRAEDLPEHDPQPVTQVPIDRAKTILALQPQSFVEGEPAPVLDLTDAEMTDSEKSNTETGNAAVAGEPEPAAPADAESAAHDADGEDTMNEPESDAPDALGDEPLLAESARVSMRESLAALALLAQPGARPQIVRSGETSLEGLTRDLLRPMLGEWLEKNLPPMVDRLVAAEIARIVGKRG